MLDLYEHLRLIDNMSRIHMYIVYLQERIQDSCTDLCKKKIKQHVSYQPMKCYWPDLSFLPIKGLTKKQKEYSDVVCLCNMYFAKIQKTWIKNIVISLQ